MKEINKKGENTIENTRHSNNGTRSFSLSGGLISILSEESLAQRKQLQLLDLSRNLLSTLPESLKQLSQLRSLNLSCNRFSSLPEFIAQLTQLQTLELFANSLSSLPESMGKLTQLQTLDISGNQLTTLPESLSQLTQLQTLDITGNRLTMLPESLGQLTELQTLNLAGNQLSTLPKSLGQLTQLQTLNLAGNQLTTLPESLNKLTQLRSLTLSTNQLRNLPGFMADVIARCTAGFIISHNPLNSELAAAYGEGNQSIMRYLRAKAEAQVAQYEAKLILIGEGEVGKSSLLSALRDEPWEDGRPTTHGIEIKPFTVGSSKSGIEITLNCWDFGGQRVYRPTHQLFFSAPAIYLVVWKPREGAQQGFVNEWIKLVKHREPEAKIFVVATHGGPKLRQPDIDRQEIWDLFGKDTVLDFFLVECKPDEKTRERKGITELKQSIARLAASLPEMGRTVPQRWDQVRNALKKTGAPYLPLKQVLTLCQKYNLDEDEASDFIRISHRLGHLIHYAHNSTLRRIVVLKPDWLAVAISFVLDDEQTRMNHGLVSTTRLSHLWNNPNWPKKNRYPAMLHPVFLMLMERFDLSYRIADLGKKETDSTSLIAQLIPEVRPNPVPGWATNTANGDEQQVQICRIVETNTELSAKAEGLFSQLIVRLHKYSLGRADYAASTHWQRGLILEDDTGARAFLEHIGNDVRITVRSPYPERFLAALTYDVKWLVENFWQGLRCEVTVPCMMKLSNGQSCKGLFEVGKLIENKRGKRFEQPCPVCNNWQDIEKLLRNAPASRPAPWKELEKNSTEAIRKLEEVRHQLKKQQNMIIGRFDRQDAATKELISKMESTYTWFTHMLLDEAKDGPRLFSFEPVEPGFFDRPCFLGSKFRVTLWCEHSRLPLPALNGKKDTRGVYEMYFPREWLLKAAPFLKLLTNTLSLVMPVASSATTLILDETVYNNIKNQLDLGQKSLDMMLKGGKQLLDNPDDTPLVELEPEIIRAHGATLRQFHAWLTEKDPGFGDLVRVRNRREEFLWVHPQFETEY